jgi:hypothetical protein
LSSPPLSGPGEGGGGSTEYSWWTGWTSIDSFFASIGAFFGDILGSLASPLLSIGQAIGSVGDLINNILNFLNPFSEQFFLKIAFVPSQEFMNSFTGDIKDSFEGKFAFVSQFRDTWNSITNTVGKDSWEGITYNNPIIGEVVIVNPIAVNAYSHKIKFWIGGCVVLLTIVMTIRRIGGIAGGGHVS